MLLKKICFFSLIFAYSIAISQDQAVIFYKAEINYKMAEDPEMIKNSEGNPIFLKRLLEVDQNISLLLEETNFILAYKEGESIFEMEPLVEHEKNKFSKAVSTNTDTKGIFYSNWNTKEFIRQKQTIGKTFLIHSEPTVWQTVNETKKIGEYMCYKAISYQKRMLRNGNSKDVELIAWYAPEIPISSGPKNFGGLPGLILELNLDNVIIFTVHKIDLNPTREITIKKPTKGEQISKSELDKRINEVMTSMRN